MVDRPFRYTYVSLRFLERRRSNQGEEHGDTSKRHPISAADRRRRRRAGHGECGDGASGARGTSIATGEQAAGIESQYQPILSWQPAI
jgi:hypothetical protein